MTQAVGFKFLVVAIRIPLLRKDMRFVFVCLFSYSAVTVIDFHELCNAVYVELYISRYMNNDELNSLMHILDTPPCLLFRQWEGRCLVTV